MKKSKTQQKTMMDQLLALESDWIKNKQAFLPIQRDGDRIKNILTNRFISIHSQEGQILLRMKQLSQAKKKKILSKLQLSFPYSSRQLLQKTATVIDNHDRVSTSPIYSNNRLNMTRLKQALTPGLVQELFPSVTFTQEQQLNKMIQRNKHGTLDQCVHAYTWDEIIKFMKICFRLRRRLLYEGTLRTSISKEGIWIADEDDHVLTIISMDKILLDGMPIINSNNKKFVKLLFCRFIQGIKIISLIDRVHYMKSVVLGEKQRMQALRVQDLAKLRIVSKPFQSIKYPNEQQQVLIYKARRRGIPAPLANIINAPYMAPRALVMRNMLHLLLPSGTTTIPIITEIDQNNIPVVQFNGHLWDYFNQLFATASPETFNKILVTWQSQQTHRTWNVFIPCLIRVIANNETIYHPVLVYIHGSTFVPPSDYFPGNLVVYIIDLMQERLHTKKEVLYTNESGMREVAQLIRIAMSPSHGNYMDLHDDFGNIFNIRPVGFTDEEFQNTIVDDNMFIPLNMVIPP